MTTDDGDFVDLDWSEPTPTSPHGRATGPLLLILHGLEGSVRSHYVGGLLLEAAARQWRAVTIHAEDALDHDDLFSSGGSA